LLPEIGSKIAVKNAKATDDMANHFVYYFGLFLLPILASTLVSHFGVDFPT
jgi:hypothetical protein